MDDLDKRSADCGCCAGVDSETPRRIGNAPGLAAITYRAGCHARFKESLLARLSSSAYPALRKLGSRDDDDFTIALCDALATSLDVLTFYQERIANEHYLRTATEDRSVLEMARLIGYEPAPGVAASTYLAFTLQDAPGDPAQAAAPISIPLGTRVQSVPGQDEEPQTFETVDVAEARLEWNAVSVQVSELWRPVSGDTDLYLQGVATQLQPGDAIVIVGADRYANLGSERWDVRVLDSVEPDTENERTRIAWVDPIGHVNPDIEPAAEAVHVFAFRQRAALFGHNAPDPNLLGNDDSNIGTLIDKKTDPNDWEWKKYRIDPKRLDLDSSHPKITAGSSFAIDNPDATDWEWKNYQINPDRLDLDVAYPKITAGSWFALVSNEEGMGTASLPGYVELYRAEKVYQVSRTAFGLSAKITRIRPDTDENLDANRFKIPDTLVLAQSESLTPVERPVLHPVYGDRMALAVLVDGLRPGQAVAVSGKRQRLAVASGVNHLVLKTDDGDEVALVEDDSLILLEPPEQMIGSTPSYLNPEAFASKLGDASVELRLRLMDRDGRGGLLSARASEVVQAASLEDDPEVADVAIIATGSDAITADRDRTILKFADALKHCYERARARINANVVRATHGETVNEILGDGDASRRDQSFTLKQPPLTYVSADTPRGRASTLSLRVNELLWKEAPTLYGREADARVYTVAHDDSGKATLRFGDGVEGARLPSGQSNVRTTYRKGLGVGGNVGAGKLSNLLSRPLGVKEAVNPEPASGGEDRETLDRARENAPLTVLTLDRTVSVKDYADFARAYAGIDKAHALWIPAGPARGIFLTVAGIDGAAVTEVSDTHRFLLSALKTYGDPLVPVRLEDYRPVVFRTRMSLKVAADYETDAVLLAVEDALRHCFGFNQRRFGQRVTRDEVMAVAHGVAGVEAVHVTELYRPGPGVTPSREQHLQADLPVASLKDLPMAAELLTLSDDPLELGELP